MKAGLTTIALLWTGVGCGFISGLVKKTPTEPAPSPSALAEAEVSYVPPEPEPLGPIEIKPVGAPPPEPAKQPSIKVLAPKWNDAIPVDAAAAYQVKLDITDWAVSKRGVHVHISVDNEPYYTVYDSNASFKLSNLFPERKVPEGEHVLMAFPCRETHISVKPSKGHSPLVVVPFWIGMRSKQPKFRSYEPILVYSQPKGDYVDDRADSVFVDFYLSHAELSDKKYSLLLTVEPPNGSAQTETVTKWVPYVISNLPPGQTKIKVELQKAGQAVPGMWNTQERTIQVIRPRKKKKPQAPPPKPTESAAAAEPKG